MLKAYKYRLYPTNDQITLIHKTFGCVRYIYNHYLALQKDRHRYGMKHLSKFDCLNDWNHKFKCTEVWLSEPDSRAAYNAIGDLDSAYDRFFKKNARYPRFKRKKTEQSYTTDCIGHNIRVNDKSIRLPKLGDVRAKVHRMIPDGSVIKKATVRETASHKFYVSVLVDTPDKIPTAKTVIHADKVLGLDYSMHDFYVDNYNRSPEDQHFYKHMEKKLAREQKKLSRMIEAAKRDKRPLSECHNIQKQKTVVARIHEKIANRRLDFTNKLSAVITKQYDAVVVEDINLRGMAGSLKFGKSVNDNGFGEFRRQLAYKLLWAGKYLVTVDKFYASTQICSTCGCKYEGIRGVEHLNDREWTCPECGTHHYRDQNAAINLKNEGVRILQSQGVLVV